MPVAILLPAGEGSRLRREMRDLIVHMRTNIQQIYESDAYKERTKEVVERYKETEKELIRLFEDRIKAENFALIQVQLGPFSKPEIAPLIAGEPHQIDRLEGSVREGKFSKEEFERLRAEVPGAYDAHGGHLPVGARPEAEASRRARRAREGVRPAGRRRIPERPQVGIRKSQGRGVPRRGSRPDSLEHGAVHREGRRGATDSPSRDRPERYLQYQVNVLVDNSAAKRPPVIVETSPNYRNLFGTIEKVVDRSGHWRSDFTHIKAGSLLRANGGFIVLNLYDFIGEPGVWSALKRTLKNRLIDIQGYDPMYLFTASALKPEPIPIRVRVVVIGDAHSYRILYGYDPDFRKIFKVKADFDSVMPRNGESIDRYARFIRKIQSEEGLLPMDRGAMAAVLEQGVRLSGRQSKLTTRFSEIADLVRESTYWTRQANEQVVSAQHVRTAIEKRVRRVGLVEDKIQEMIVDGTLMVDSDGDADRPGQRALRARSRRLQVRQADAHHRQDERRTGRGDQHRARG